MDPIADQYPHVTTYNYAENRPIDGIDLWGLQYVNVMSADKNGVVAPTHTFGSTVYQGRSVTKAPRFNGPQASISAARQGTLDPVASTIGRQLATSLPMVVEDLGGTAVGLAKGAYDAYNGDYTGASLEVAGAILPDVTGSVLKKVHGNSVLSQSAQHGYEIFDMGTGEILEYGISGQRRSAIQLAEGASPRINQKLRTKYGNDPNVGGRVTEDNLGNRQQGLDWEQGKVNENARGNNGEGPRFQKRPQPK